MKPVPIVSLAFTAQSLLIYLLKSTLMIRRIMGTVICLVSFSINATTTAADTTLAERSAQGTELKTHEVVVVVPEDIEPTSSVTEQVAISVPSESANLVGSWIFPNNSSKPFPVKLFAIDEQRRKLSGRLAGEIGMVPSDNQASYRLGFSDDPILAKQSETLAEQPGVITVTIDHAHRLEPGVYHGIVPFAIRLSPIDTKEGSVAPDDLQKKLSLLVIKYGRRLNELRLHTTSDSGPQLAFGKPWNIELGVDEFGIPNQRLTMPLDVAFEVNLAHRRPGTVAPALTEDSTTIRLSQFVMREDETGDLAFVPAAGADAGLSHLWKELLFDPVAFQSDRLQEKETSADRVFIYNSRTQKGGQGPTTWYDPVIWKAGRIAQQKLTDYSVKSPKTQLPSHVSWMRRTIKIGLPAMDVLGRVSAMAHLTKKTKGNAVTASADVAAGFALFPHVAVVGEVLQFVAATSDGEMVHSVPRFQFRHTQGTAAEFSIRMQKEAAPRGVGVRFTLLDPDKSPSHFPLRHEGIWEISYAPSSPDVGTSLSNEWGAVARTIVIANCEIPRPLVVFAGPRPDIFDLPFSGASNREPGHQTHGDGWTTTSKTPVSWKVAAGVALNVELAPLPAIRVISSERYVATDQPRCIVQVRDVSKKEPRPEWEPVSLTGPQFDLTIAFSDRTSAEKLKLPESLEQRHYLFGLPYLIRAELDDGSSFLRTAVRPIPFRIRSERDYRDLRFFYWGMVTLIIVLLCIFGWVLWSTQRITFSEARGVESVPPKGASDVLDAPAQEILELQVTPPTSAPSSMPSQDEEPPML